MKIEMKKFITGPLENNTYLIKNGEDIESKDVILIDPSSGCSEIIKYIKSEDLNLIAVILTHGHFDHFIGLREIIEAFGDIEVFANSLTVPFLRNPLYNGSSMIGATLSYDGEITEFNEGELKISEFKFKVLHIPGHSPGGSAFVFDGICFSGDSLFAGSVGRTDFQGCDAVALIKNIKEKLLTLPEDTVVCSGHGGRTTIGREIRRNPFLR